MLLKFTVFISGAVVMSLEILASRVLATSFGSSLDVWGALIGAFIGALSLGYWLGGVLVDRRPEIVLLAVIISASGALVLVSSGIANPANDMVAAMSMSPSLAVWLKPLLSSALIYMAPVTLLGMVIPFAVRLASHDLKRLGKRVGGFYAISSLGSIFGVFITSFYLIGIAGINRITILEGLLLLALSIPFYLTALIRRKKNRHYTSGRISVE